MSTSEAGQQIKDVDEIEPDESAMNASIDYETDNLLMKQRGEIMNQSLGKRIKGNTIDIYDYLKHDGVINCANKKKTGEALLINKTINLQTTY